MLDIGWFSTGRGPGSRGLLRFIQESISQGRLNARIQFVFSNRAPGEETGSDEFFRLVRAFGLPLVTLSSSQFRRAAGGPFSQHREEYDRQVMDRLKDFHLDLGILAGYMLIVSGAMCRHYPLLNLHPALPNGPTGTWQEVIWSLIAARAPISGGMVHLVTEEVDRGPVVSYFTVPITGDPFDCHWQALDRQDLAEIRTSQGEDFPLFQLIRQTEYQREAYLLLATLQAIAAGEIVVRTGQVVNREGRPLSQASPGGIRMDAAIERVIAKHQAGDARPD